MGIAMQSVRPEGEDTTRRSTTIWFVVALLFTIGNLAGLVFAARGGEFTHAAVHALLVFFGAKAAWGLAPSSVAQTAVVDNSHAMQASIQAWQDRLQRIEQSVEAVAIEVERIGEGQRFLTQLYASKDARDGIPRDNTPLQPPLR